LEEKVAHEDIEVQSPLHSPLEEVERFKAYAHHEETSS
jgi:hypothetical protein